MPASDRRLGRNSGRRIVVIVLLLLVLIGAGCKVINEPAPTTRSLRSHTIDAIAATHSNTLGNGMPQTGVSLSSSVTTSVAYRGLSANATSSIGIITTVAGGGYNYDVGQATASSVRRPTGAGVDAWGNIYIAENESHRVRMVSKSNGIITTVAGTGENGYTGDGGQAWLAQVGSLVGIAVHASGSFYITDTWYHVVRMVTKSTGIISAVAGTGSSGYNGDGRLGTSASLYFPMGVAVDVSGNVFIADDYNFRIRMVRKSTGIISTVVGTGVSGYSGGGGQATLTQLSYPHGVAVDLFGDIYISEAGTSYIRKVSVGTGIMTIVAGNEVRGMRGDGGQATAANLKDPYGLAVDRWGNILIADMGNNRIRLVSNSTGIITTVAGGGYLNSVEGGPATSVTLDGPTGVSVDPSGNIFISDSSNNRVRMVAMPYASPPSNLSTHSPTRAPSSYGMAPYPASPSNWYYSSPQPAPSRSSNVYPTSSPSSYGMNPYPSPPQWSYIYPSPYPTSPAQASGIITTIAGTGGYGYKGDGGLAKLAPLSSPKGIVLDAWGNIYFSDMDNSRIRMVTRSTGIITTVAGNGQFGNSGDGGQAKSAILSSPLGIALDASGNVYIVDTQNNRIRMITKSTGIITTVAGGGYSSGDGGQATSTYLGSPQGVAVDTSGNIYITETSNNVIRMVTKSTGIITAVAGTGVSGYSGDGGLATSAKLSYPYGIAVDVKGNIYVTDDNNYRIRMVRKSTGIITTIAGTGISGYGGDGGQATAAQVNTPYGIAVDIWGNVYFADSSIGRIRMVRKSTGVIATVAGGGIMDSMGHSFGGDGGPATSALLSYPYGVAVDAWGNVFVADSNNNRIRMISLNKTHYASSPPNLSPTPAPSSYVSATSIITTVAGNGGFGFSGDGGQATAAQIYNPTGIALDALGNVYMVDTNNHRVRLVTNSTGIITTLAGNGLDNYSGDGGQATAAHLSYPLAIALDSLGNIYISDSGCARIRKVTISTGIITTVAGNGEVGSSGDGGQATSASLKYPYGIALDTSGNIYISDTGANRIRMVTRSSGVITTVAGTGGYGNSGDGGQATLATFYTPYGIALDTWGNIYIADATNYRIRMVRKSTGIITTVAGTGVSGFSGDRGQAISAKLFSPHYVSVDASGNIYIADQDSPRIRVVANSTGVISTVLSGDTAGYFIPNTQTNFILAMTIDTMGSIYFSESGNNRIRKFSTMAYLQTAQVFTGLTSYQASTPTFQAALMSTVSSTIGVSPSAVTLDTISGQNRRVLLSDIVLSYSFTVILSALNSNVAVLTSRLNAAVLTGTFATSLSSYSGIPGLGVTGTFSGNSSTSISSPTTAPGNSPSAAVSPGTIGAIIGGILGGLICLALLYWSYKVYLNKLSDSDPAAGTVNDAIQPYGMSADDPFLAAEVPEHVEMAPTAPSLPRPLPPANRPLLSPQAPRAPVTYPTSTSAYDPHAVRLVKWVNL